MPNASHNNTQHKKLGTRQQGEQAETIALQYLLTQGLNLITRNFHCRGGEIDLIMYNDQQKMLVIIEVRMRNHRLVSAAESITPHKQKRIMRCTEYFLLKHPQFQHCNLRFDVVLFNNQLESPEWISDAFDAM